MVTPDYTIIIKCRTADDAKIMEVVAKKLERVLHYVPECGGAPNRCAIVLGESDSTCERVEGCRESEALRKAFIKSGLCD